MIRVILLASVLSLSGCGLFGKKHVDAGNPLCIANCPKELPLLLDPSLGATDKLMIEWAGIYHKCAASCLGETK